MKIIKDYIRLLLFVGGSLIGVQVPSFVGQYEQRLEAHLLESKASLNEFQMNADKFFEGDFDKLLKHYQDNSDPVFNEGGKSISNLFSRQEQLNNAMLSFNKTFFNRYFHTLVSPLPDIRDETWKSYDYSIKLNAASIIWALSVGLISAILMDLLLALMSALFLSNGKKDKPLKRHRNNIPASTPAVFETSLSDLRTPPNLQS